jgi:hypothetical protein
LGNRCTRSKTCKNIITTRIFGTAEFAFVIFVAAFFAAIRTAIWVYLAFTFGVAVLAGIAVLIAVAFNLAIGGVA